MQTVDSESDTVRLPVAIIMLSKKNLGFSSQFNEFNQGINGHTTT